MFKKQYNIFFNTLQNYDWEYFLLGASQKILRWKELHLNTSCFSSFLYSNLLTWLNLNSFSGIFYSWHTHTQNAKADISFFYLSEYLLCTCVCVCVCVCVCICAYVCICIENLSKENSSDLYLHTESYT